MTFFSEIRRRLRFRRSGAGKASRHEPTDWRVTLKRRALVAGGLLGLWAAGIEFRLVYLQIIKHGEYVGRAERQHSQIQKAPAKRGDIIDRSGMVLATSADADTIYAVPSVIAEPERAATVLCRALADCTAKERQALTERLSRKAPFAYVRRQVSPDQRRHVEDLNLDGIGFVKESRRFYPNKELASHLLGYVGIDNTGLSGIEAAYDSQIRGKNGKLLVQTDARRHAFSRFESPPTAGATIELTLDEYLQHVAERELHAGVLENRAAGGSAIVMNPHTGEILAMANEPTFNPNAFNDVDEANRRNRAVQDLYEPGSTFKVVTVSAALEERVMAPGTMIDTHPGRIAIGSRVITENAGHDYGVLPLSQVIVKSSNVGAIKIGLRVGTERLSRYVNVFGFGRPVSPDFPGESPGIVWSPEKWTDSALASVSMGYQVGVTPLQIVAAVSSVANGGELVEPRVIRAVYNDGRRYAVQPKVVRRTISRDTAATLTSIMEGVIGDDHGTAKSARIPGFSIAGKTGTAAKLVNGRYSHSEYNASFVGFIPSRNPAVAIVVVIDSPHGPNRYFGGTVSAPIFKRIAEATLQYLGIPRTIDPDPPVLIARNETPATAGMPTVPEPVVSLVAEGTSSEFPDLRGMSAREAMRRVAKLGLSARIAGDGFVVSQEPAPGTPLDSISMCRLTLHRSAARIGPGVVSP